MKHTLGPWKILEDDDDNIIYNNDGRGICEIWETLPHEQVEANAHLIAAAPEMLEALKYVVQYHREHDSGEGELFGLDFVTTCINAIAKAEGR